MEHAANTLTKQDLYIRGHRRHHRTIGILRILVFLVFLALWEGSVRLGVLDSFFFSSPTLVVRTCIDLWLQNDLATHIGITVIETLLSFSLVTFLSMVIACLLWFSRSFSEVCEPYLVILNSLPKSALAPLFRLAGNRYGHHYCGRNLCGSLRSNYQHLFRFSSGIRRKTKSDLHTWGLQDGYILPGSIAQLRSPAFEYNEG